MGYSVLTATGAGHEKENTMTTITRTAAKSVQLPVGSATALVAYANDAANWSGNPWVNGNVNFGKATGGYMTKLVAAGYITLGTDGEETFISFTDAGIDAALALGADASIDAYRTATPEAKPAKTEVKVVSEVGNTIRGLVTVELTRTCRKGADHEFRVTNSGSYCYTCDRAAAEAQKAARAAAKAASNALLAEVLADEKAKRNA